MQPEALNALRAFAKKQAMSCHRRASKVGNSLLCSKLTKEGVEWDRVAKKGTRVGTKALVGARG